MDNIVRYWDVEYDTRSLFRLQGLVLWRRFATWVDIMYVVLSLTTRSIINYDITTRWIIHDLSPAHPMVYMTFAEKRIPNAVHMWAMQTMYKLAHHSKCMFYVWACWARQTYATCAVNRSVMRSSSKAHHQTYAKASLQAIYWMMTKE